SRLAALSEDLLDPRDVFPGLAEQTGVVLLADGILHAVAEQVLGEGLLQRGEVLAGTLAQVFGLHDQSTPRLRNLVDTGSFAAATSKASRAISSGTPETSNSTRPGLITATHSSTEPLPEPMRTSSGFLVSGLSGKMRMNSLP